MYAFAQGKAVPNLTGAAIGSYYEQQEGGILVIVVHFGGAGGNFRHLTREVVVRNGQCSGWLISANPTSVETLLTPVVVNLPDGLDNLWAAIGAGTRAQKLAAAETYLANAGLLPAGA